MRAALLSMFNLKCMMPVRFIFKRELSLRQGCYFRDDSVIGLENRSDTVQKDSVKIHDM